MTYEDARKVLLYLQNQARQMNTPPAELCEAARIMHDECLRMEKETPVYYHAINVKIPDAEQLLRELEDKTFRCTIRKCSVTGELCVVGKDGMTEAERKNHEEIVESWKQ